MQKQPPQWPQMLIMVSGALLILVGVIAVCLQSYRETNTPNLTAGLTQELKAAPTSFQVTTRFPGIELIIIGAVLELAGYFGSRPWSGSQNPN
jgi:hypothetical protein